MSELERAIAEVARPHKARVLFIDIENTPTDAYVWGLWKQNVTIDKIIEPGRVFAFASKWLGDKTVTFFSDHEHGHEAMIQAAWMLLNQADIVVTYNGIGFDIPHLQREFLLAGLRPPKPYKQIDLLKVVRKQFAFASNKLDYVSQQLGLGRKTSHEGFELWTKCMAGDPKAWARMGRYARQDVRLTEKLYHALLPWLTTVPHMGVINGTEGSCWACGGTRLQAEGESYAFVSIYPLFQCRKCGAWMRGTKKLDENTGTRQQKVN